MKFKLLLFLFILGLLPLTTIAGVYDLAGIDCIQCNEPYYQNIHLDLNRDVQELKASIDGSTISIQNQVIYSRTELDNINRKISEVKIGKLYKYLVQRHAILVIKLDRNCKFLIKRRKKLKSKGNRTLASNGIIKQYCDYSPSKWRRAIKQLSSF